MPSSPTRTDPMPLDAETPDEAVPNSGSAVAPRGERKAPRRTAERILDHSLALFNRYGEPHVSTTVIAAELRISPGNLYYHFPAKEALVNALVDRYERALDATLAEAGDPTDAVCAWRLVPALLRLGWDYRFIFRDLNDLLTRNRQLETRCQAALARQTAAIRARVGPLCRLDGQPLDAEGADALATSIVVLLTYWLSYEYVRAPRQALEPANADAAISRGTRQAMALLWPYLRAEHRGMLKGADTVALADQPFPPR
ncbi:TetR/AcrR family transcriptional regulator [Leptothrix discophora]|uniref:TetR/AcrR family transcriptional regulator n=1 Tax=Leptothrix discophora TaxID=89 RepID=A0ABT9G4Y9_LEPDI|nr:TetR/AcrR family transcriptional regulator [Leptothrix discophora]MDP4301527.1 TetR/AcrR family transcriptional regulator [Leptothrix discophora]